MSTRQYGDTVPVAARATPAGQGALALIRTSGENSIELLAKIFSRPKALLEAGGNTVIHGWIMQGADRIDEVLVSVYRAPKSYTGEDGADISCHGGEAAVKASLEILRKAGFADALPGEFTFRAFMNGKIDLTRSESVMELVSAKTSAAVQRAVGRLSGALEKELLCVRDKLLEALASVEIVLDYPEDEIDGARIPPYREAAAEALGGLDALASSYGRERLYRDGALAVIAGRPNAGKSSLFNALLGEDRSIVTNIPGTTRDWIEGSFSLEGIPIRLADTAGLRGMDSPADPVEKIGIDRSRELLEDAGVIVYVIDGLAGLTAEDRMFLAPEKTNVIPVWNKADLVPFNSASIVPAVIDGNADLVALSAKTGRGMEQLCTAIVKKLGGKDPAAGLPSAGLGTERQKNLVDRARADLKEALADKNGEPELTAPLLRDALNALGEITGEISTLDILETMFSRFCVGK